MSRSALRVVVVVILGGAGVTGCGDAAPSCALTLFGTPNARTGLGADQCGPACACDDLDFVAPTYTADDLAALRTWQLREPLPPIVDDPYARPAPPIADGTFCAVVRDDPAARRYHLATFASRAEAEAAGAAPTHAGPCGACSTLVDLAVYIETPDLTEPVRACGLNHSGTAEEHVQCLRDLGFTEPCAQIWYFNTLHTRDRCLGPCLLALDAPYHLPDGTLNECLRCDEVESGPVFKAIAGRTRRNTGVPSAMCRPCSEVEQLVHRY